MTINEIAEKGYKHAQKNRFYGSNAETAIHDKLLEEVDEFQTAHCSDIDVFNDALTDKTDYCKMFEALIKNSEGDELADIVITSLAGARKLGIDIDAHIIAKLYYNEKRDDHR